MDSPQIEPYKTHSLPVSDLHTLYVEESGNPEGIPILLIHGGPGGKSKPDKRTSYNPEKRRVIQYDQRGCGKSTPFGELQENTKQHLVEDIEKIRHYLGVERRVVHGGSRGSALALAYGQTHPTSVTAFLLRGVFTGRKQECAWTYVAGNVNKFYPDVREKFVELVPEEYRHDPRPWYIQKLVYEEQVAPVVSQRWGLQEASLLTLQNKKDTSYMGLDDASIAMNKLFLRYEQHHFFLEEGQLLEDKNITKIKHLPCIIINGRYDMVCPPITAWELHKKRPGSELHLIQDAGHLGSEPSIQAKIIEVAEKRTIE